MTVDSTAPLLAALVAIDRVCSSPPTIVDVLPLREIGRLEVMIEVETGRRYRLAVSRVAS